MICTVISYLQCSDLMWDTVSSDLPNIKSQHIYYAERNAPAWTRGCPCTFPSSAAARRCACRCAGGRRPIEEPASSKHTADKSDNCTNHREDNCCTIHTDRFAHVSVCRRSKGGLRSLHPRLGLVHMVNTVSIALHCTRPTGHKHVPDINHAGQITMHITQIIARDYDVPGTYICIHEWTFWNINMG